MFRLVQNAFVRQIFTMPWPDKTLPHVLILTPPRQREITNSPMYRFSKYLSPRQKGKQGGNYGSPQGLFFKMAPVIQ